MCFLNFLAPWSSDFRKADDSKAVDIKRVLQHILYIFWIIDYIILLSR